MKRGRIYFDGEVFCWVRSGGLFSAVHILSALRKRFQVSVFIPSEFRDRSASLQTHYRLPADEVIPLPVTRRTLLALKLLGFPPPGLKLTGADVVFLTNTNVFKGIERQICICHDLMSVTAPKYFRFRDRLMTNYQIRRLRDPKIAVICHSEHVAEQVSRLVGVEDTRLLKLPLGLVSRPSRSAVPERPSLSNRPMEALFVSAYHPRKNFERLIGYVRRLNREVGNVIRLTVAGPGLRTHLSSEEDAWIRVRDFVPEDEYAAMFYNSDVHINPSGAEGFGISNLDAQGYGLPVMCNDLPVFHETLGDSAAYFDADDYSSFSRGILRLLNDSEYRRALIDSGFNNVQGSTYVENIDRILIPWLVRSCGDALLTTTTT